MILRFVRDDPMTFEARCGKSIRRVEENLVRGGNVMTRTPRCN